MAWSLANFVRPVRFLSVQLNGLAGVAAQGDLAQGSRPNIHTVAVTSALTCWIPQQSAAKRLSKYIR